MFSCYKLSLNSVELIEFYASASMMIIKWVMEHNCITLKAGVRMAEKLKGPLDTVAFLSDI